MGLILDSSVAITAERRKAPVEDLLAEIRAVAGPTEIALSVVSVMELEHGIWRAHDAGRAKRRREFLEDLIATVPIYPLTVELARKAGRIDGSCSKKAFASLSRICLSVSRLWIWAMESALKTCGTSSESLD